METDNLPFVLGITQLILGIIGIGVIFYFFMKEPNETIFYNCNGLRIVMPEEIPIAKKGDLLQVIEVKNGIIYIGFKH